MNINWKAAIDNIQSLVTHGSFANRDAVAMAQSEQEKQANMANQEMNKRMIEEQKAREKEMEDAKKSVNERIKFLDKQISVIQKSMKTDLASPNTFSESAAKLRELMDQRDAIFEEGKQLLGFSSPAKQDSQNPEMINRHPNLDPYSPDPSVKSTMPDGSIFDFRPHMKADTEWGLPPQPPANVAKALWDKFGPYNDATASALTAYTESLYNPNSYYKNTAGRLKGTEDIGLMGFNSGTPDDPSQISALNDYIDRFAKRGKDFPVKSQKELYDVNKNLDAAIYPYLEGGKDFGRWFGWQDRGYQM